MKNHISFGKQIKMVYDHATTYTQISFCFLQIEIKDCFGQVNHLKCFILWRIDGCFV